MARFFYLQYRLLCANQNIFYKAKGSKVFRTIVIETFLSRAQLELSSGLVKEAIEGLAAEHSIENVREIAAERLRALNASLPLQLQQRIDHFYSNLLGFINLALYDYHFLLKRFDSALPECDLYYRPTMRPAGGRILSDMLKDWLEVACSFSPHTEWQRVTESFSRYARAQTVSVPARKLQRAMSFVEQVLQTDILLLIVRYIDHDLSYRPAIGIKNERICEGYLRDIRSSVEGYISELAKRKREQGIEELIEKLFGVEVPVSLSNYTETKNALLSHSSSKLRYTQELNYVYLFLSDTFENGISGTLQDALILRAEWASRVQARRFSQLVYQIKNLRNEIEEFDDSLSERPNLGEGFTRLVLALQAGNQIAHSQIERTIESVNTSAFRFVTRCYQAMLAILRFLKPIIADLGKAEIVNNWDELRLAVPDIGSKLRTGYESMYYFLRLMQMLIKRKRSTELAL